MGPTMEPCETPGMIASKSLATLLVCTNCWLCERYEQILDMNEGRQVSFELFHKFCN